MICFPKPSGKADAARLSPFFNCFPLIFNRKSAGFEPGSECIDPLFAAVPVRKPEKKSKGLPLKDFSVACGRGLQSSRHNGMEHPIAWYSDRSGSRFVYFLCLDSHIQRMTCA
jgi:hypothetical protein